MQTFVPLDTLDGSARVLDMKRLGKQRVETYQLLGTISGLRVGNTYSESTISGKKVRVNHPESLWRIEKAKTTGWVKHPAAIMWRHNLLGLLRYQEATVAEWLSRGYNDTCLAKSRFLVSHADDALKLSHDLPAWWGDEAVHASHRSALLFKNYEHYSQFGWTDSAEWNYVWPEAS